MTKDQPTKTSPLYSKTTNIHDDKQTFKPQSVHGFDSNDDEDEEFESEDDEGEISQLTALHEGGSKDNKKPTKKPTKEEKKGLLNLNPKTQKKPPSQI